MTTTQLGGTIRKVFDRVRDAADHGDGELLSRYRAERDQEAFGSLVRRHGPMVLGVCRRVLRDSHAADDAFQATFLVLAKKADAVRPPSRLGSWLYGVAYRTALKARGRAYRRHQVEQNYAATTASRTPGADASRLAEDTADLLPLIDEQLNALPEKYRTPLVLCGVQGLNKAEAAEKLGLPEGTVSSRLARAREMLRDRLARRGVVVPAVAFSTLFTADTLQAAVPAALAETASAAALGSTTFPATVLSLSHEVIRSMTLLNFKFLGAIALSVSLAGGGVGLIALNADDKKPQPAPGTDVKKPAKPAPDGEKPKPAPDGQKPVKPAPDGEKPPVKPNPNEKNGNNNQNGEGNKPKPAPDGEKPAKPAAGKVVGKVAGIDEKSNSLTLAFTGDAGTVEKTIKLSATTKVFIDGKEAKLGDVQKGSLASLISKGTKDGVPPEVTEVYITGASLKGIVKQVDASSVTLAGEGGDKVLKTTADVKVTVNGKDAKLADLKAGDKVGITLTAKGDAVAAIITGTGDGGEKPGVKKPDTGEKAAVGMQVSAVDAAASTVTTQMKGKEFVMKVAANAKISVDGKDAKLADIPKGAFVTFSGSKEGNKEATEVRATGESFVALVKQTDATTITLQTPKTEKNPGTERVFKIAAIEKLLIAGKAAKVSDLKADDKVVVTLSADGMKVLSITSGPAGDKVKPVKPDGEDDGDDQ